MKIINAHATLEDMTNLVNTFPFLQEEKTTLMELLSTLCQQYSNVFTFENKKGKVNVFCCSFDENLKIFIDYEIIKMNLPKCKKIDVFLNSDERYAYFAVSNKIAKFKISIASNSPYDKNYKYDCFSEPIIVGSAFGKNLQVLDGNHRLLWALDNDYKKVQHPCYYAPSVLVCSSILGSMTDVILFSLSVALNEYYKKKPMISICKYFEEFFSQVIASLKQNEGITTFLGRESPRL